MRMVKGDMQWAVLGHTWAMGCWLLCAAVLLTDTRSIHVELLHSALQNMAATFKKTNCTVPVSIVMCDSCSCLHANCDTEDCSP
jgi:hypothetical protein